MTAGIPRTLLSRLSNFVADHLGLYFPEGRWRDLERGIRSAAQVSGWADIELYINQLLASPLTDRETGILASHLSVGETYFFREKRIFTVLEESVLPGLIENRRSGDRRLRIWSAGCSTGEEPYSVAILLCKIIPDLDEWNITILGTDLNPAFLQKATGGIYSEWSFRDTPSWVRDRYFITAGNDRLEIIPAIKKMVRFSYLNLAEDVYPSLLNGTGAMDIIFCRNVLMYFEPVSREKVIGRLFGSLVDGGCLIVGFSEFSPDFSYYFTAVEYNGVFFYRKESLPDGPADDFVISRPGQPEPESASLTASGPPDAVGTGGPAQPLLPEYKTCLVQEESPQAVTMDYSQGPEGEPAGDLSGDCCSGAAAAVRPGRDGSEAAHLARFSAGQGKHAEALDWCQKAIAAEKFNPSYHYLHAVILQEQGQMEKSAAALKKALYLDPDFVLAHFALGSLASMLGHSSESGKHFANALLLLRRYGREEVLPESEGITAGRLSEVIESMIESGERV
jgi:chemotaxis protein methyltransferase CheR